jgi:hypothetical protein
VAQRGKPANHKLVLVLAALFIITLASLITAIALYTSEMSIKDKQIQQLNDQLDSIEAQIANLNLTAPAPNLIPIGVSCIDNRTNATAPFLHVTGYVVNVGNAKADNCTIHVLAIQPGNSTAIDSSVSINSLNAGTYEKIDVQFPYNGQALILYVPTVDWAK